MRRTLCDVIVLSLVYLCGYVKSPGSKSDEAHRLSEATPDQYTLGGQGAGMHHQISYSRCGDLSEVPSGQGAGMHHRFCRSAFSAMRMARGSWRGFRGHQKSCSRRWFREHENHVRGDALGNMKTMFLDLVRTETHHRGRITKTLRDYYGATFQADPL